MSSDWTSVGKVYDRAAKQYDQWAWQNLWRKNEKPLIQSALATDGFVPMGLDVGVGTGAYANLLRQYCKRIIGIDISIGMLDVLLQKHPNASCVCADAERVPLRSNSCQRILATRVLSHLMHLETFFAEAARILLPGGALIISDLDPEHEYKTIHLPDSTRNIQVAQLAPHNHSLDELTKMGQTMGFVVERSWRLRFSDLRWKPQQNELPSLDRSDSRHLFYVAVLRFL